MRRKSAEDWRRGVVFVRELVPRRAIALVARLLCGETHDALPTRHEVIDRGGALALNYEWRRDQKWESLSMSAAREAIATAADFA